MFQLLYPLIQLISPYLDQICFCFAWGLIFLIIFSILSSLKAGIKTTKRLHQIPCTDCRFFTNDYRLKCTVNPSIANTESAINCSDYCLKGNHYTTSY